jgi:hypothetical protein
VLGQNKSLQTWNQVKTATNQNGNNQNGNTPKWQHSKMATDFSL